MNTVSYVELKEKVDNMCSLLDIPLIVDMIQALVAHLTLYV